ncbi:DUF6764 family protein [Jongsikchunia kroppenstedtii]|uniref:DUF6764 family protein n=1 Tax=Jongsikchunia kroppenstedtii TaxID=1121721 RepID=UPI001FE1BF75|nr:DUF6764 family protein [Jongsikchunia kroppenstedtii]
MSMFGGQGRRVGVRLVAGSAMVAGAAATVLLVGGGTASAAPTSCTSANGANVVQVNGHSACGAKTDATGHAHAEDRSGAGSAVAVGTTGGNANSYNLNAGSTALSSAQSGGTAQSISAGGLSVAQARQGGTAIAIAGDGTRAYAGPDGARCEGFSLAYDSSTAQLCVLGLG